MTCPCGCGGTVKPGRRWAAQACYWRAQSPEARKQRAVNAVAAREHPNLVAAHRSRASALREQTVNSLLTLAVEHGRVREAIQRAYLAGYTAGWTRHVRREAAEEQTA